MIGTVGISTRVSLLLLCLFVSAVAGCGSSGGSTPLGGSALSGGSTPSGYGSVMIKVVITGEHGVLKNATVRIGDRAVTTNMTGDVIMDNVPLGDGIISITKAGYTTYASSLHVDKDTTTKLTIPLTQSVNPAAYDLVVIGAGTGGTSAAIQAARMGLKVAIVEKTDWIGGQMTAAAVTSLDEGPVPVTRSGLYKDFVDNVKNHYAGLGKSTGTAYFVATSTAFEPSVGQKILYSMMAKAVSPNQSPDLFLCTGVKGALVNEKTVGGVILDDGSQIVSKLVIDATEHGDFIPLTPARYRVGNSTSDNINLDANLNPITYTAVLRKYLGSMDAFLLIPYAPPGYTASRSMFFTWLTNGGTAGSTWYTNNSIDYSKPFSFAFHNAWRGMPDSLNSQNYDAGAYQYQNISKTGLNAFQNDYPVTARYLEDRSYRQLIDCEAKLRTLQILYYIQQELGHGDWSVARDEGFATVYNQTANLCTSHPTELQRIETNLPPIPYVRESRRIIGVGTVSVRDIKRDGIKSLTTMATALAVGDYPIDLHGGKDATDLDCGDTIDDLPHTAWGNSGGTFQVPFEIFIPEKVDGLLVAEKNLSVSRLVSGSIRLQPITMMTGQAVGALAAVSVQQGLQPRNVKPLDVQMKLLEAGCVITQYDPKDVPVSHPYWKDIQLALTYSIMSMISKFNPQSPISQLDLENIIRVNAFGLAPRAANPGIYATRQDLSLLIMQTIGPITLTNNTTGTFSDILPGHPAFAAVNYLKGLGAIPAEMIDGGNFVPDAHVTRGEVAAIVMRTLFAIKSSRIFESASNITQID
jgi:ribulose 1,5-bisphosphate synthetase/thiazole synthase